MRRYVRNKAKNRSFFVICALIAMLIVINIVVNISLRPVICDLAAQEGESRIYDLINNAVYEVMNDLNVNYSSIVSLGYNDSGFVTSCEYDYAAINQLKLSCSRLLVSKLDDLDSTKIKVPLGNAFGDINVQGKGAKIRVKLLASAVPNIEIISVFESCGINQTRHEIRLRISVDAAVYIPPQKRDFDCMQEYVLAQTIIVGDIPSGYAVLG